MVSDVMECAWARSASPRPTHEWGAQRVAGMNFRNPWDLHQGFIVVVEDLKGFAG